MANGFYSSATHGNLSYINEPGGPAIACTASDYIVDTGGNLPDTLDLTGKNIILISGGNLPTNPLRITCIWKGTATAPVKMRVANGHKVSVGNLNIMRDNSFIDILGINDIHTGHYGHGKKRPGSYALRVRPGWASPYSIAFYAGENKVTNVRFRYAEICEAKFAGVMAKNDNRSAAFGATMLDICLEDLLIWGMHEGEGFYIGSTQPASSTKFPDGTVDGRPQHVVQVKIKDCTVVCTGAEGMQLGRLAPGSIIENNVVACSATNWKTAFQGDQANAVQLNYTAGNVTFRNNIVIGSGDRLLFTDENQESDANHPHVAGTNTAISNCYFYGTRHYNLYQKDQDMTGVTNRAIDLVFTDVFFKEGNKTASEIRADTNTFYTSMVRGATDATKKWNNLRANMGYDLSTFQGSMVWTNVNVNDLGLTTQPAFPNSYLLTRWEKFEIWAPEVTSPEAETAKKVAILYKAGDVVLRPVNDVVKFFRVNADQTASSDPALSTTGYTDITEEVFDNMDMRTNADDPYATMGLTAKIVVTPAPSTKTGNLDIPFKNNPLQALYTKYVNSPSTGTIPSSVGQKRTILGGRSLLLNGTDNIVELPSYVSLAGDFSMTVWFNRTDSATADYFWGLDYLNATLTAKVGLNADNTLSVRMVRGGTAVKVNIGYTLEMNGKWNKFTFARSGGAVTAQLNDLAPVNVTTETANFEFKFFGGDDPTSSGWFKGKYYNLTVLNRVLTAQEKAMKILPIDTPGLLHQWHCEEGGTDGVIYDNKGGIHGNMKGTGIGATRYSGYDVPWSYGDQLGWNFNLRHIPAKDSLYDALGNPLLYRGQVRFDANRINATTIDLNPANSPLLPRPSTADPVDGPIPGSYILTQILTFPSTTSHCLNASLTSTITTGLDLTGVSINSYEGTAVPSISGNNIAFTTAGTLYNLRLSNGVIYPCSESNGTALHNVGTGVNATTDALRTTQGQFHWNQVWGVTAAGVPCQRDIFKDKAGNPLVNEVEVKTLGRKLLALSNITDSNLY